MTRPFSSTATVSQVMESHGGAGPGFDAIRIGLSLAIMLWHSIYIAHGREYIQPAGTLAEPLLLALVPAFFCLSGFLVTGSAIRTHNVRTFLTFRGLRIFPALIVEVSLSALLLGPIVTQISLKEYFSNKQFFAYFGNIVGRVRFTLPGVFPGNPLPDIVNASLWTLQPEFYCYLLMAALMATGLVYTRRWYSIVFVIASLAIATLDLVYEIGRPAPLVPWPVVIYSFFVGIWMFHWKDKIPVSPLLFIVCFVTAYAALMTHGLIYIASIPMAYCIVFIGMQKIPRIPLLQRGDYSYGIYLFGYPIQQTISYFFPAMRDWLTLFIVSALVTMMFAAASWHLVEKPTLRLKAFFLQKKPSASAV